MSIDLASKMASRQPPIPCHQWPPALLTDVHGAACLWPSQQVGDHKQLPATVISQAAVDMGYSRSMFARLQKRRYPSDMLTVQYR
jgi:hypothetical protein